MAATPVGYTYGTPALPPSPVSLDDLRRLEASVMWDDDDAAALRRAAEVLDGQTEDVLDVWYGFVASQPHLVAYFADLDGKPIDRYLEQVRARFGQWILDTCTRPRDEQWLAYQHEIALRHTSAKKNQTDKVESLPYIPLRHVIALAYPIMTTIRPFLARGGDPADVVDRMHQAWCKAVVLQVALWAQPYAKNEW